MNTASVFGKILTLFVLMLVASCDPHPFAATPRVVRRTVIRLEVHVDRRLLNCSSASGIQRVRVVLHNALAADRPEVQSNNYDLCDSDMIAPLPILYNINAASADGHYRIWAEAIGYPRGNRALVRQSAVFGFLPEQSAIVRLYLTQECVPQVENCNDRTGEVTCNPESGRCGSSVQEPVPMERAADAGLDADVLFANTRDASDAATEDGGDDAADSDMDGGADGAAGDTPRVDRAEASSVDLPVEDAARDLLTDVAAEAAGDVFDAAIMPDATPADRPDVSVGCGANLSNDPNNCGSCGTVCRSLAGTNVACVVGSCVLRCPAGRADCDGMVANGCETDATNDAHCGGCNPCASGRRCTAGVCTGMSCPIGYDTCDASGECAVDIRSTSEHCGGCGITCSGHCENGRCSLATYVFPWLNFTGHGFLMDNGRILYTYDAHAMRPTFVWFGGTTGVTKVSSGGSSACMMKSDGTVWCWGEGRNGELGDGRLMTSADPVQVMRAMGMPFSDAVDIAVGTNHACAVDRSGQVFCWGYTANGQAGSRGDVNSQIAYATVVAGVTAARGVRAGGAVTCAWNESQLQCWGALTNGLLGDGRDGGDSVAPQNVALPGYRIVDMAVDLTHACAIAVRTGAPMSSRQEMWCWGDGSGGRVGDGSSLTGRRLPGRIELPVADSYIARVAIPSSTYTVAILSNGLVHSWGANAVGQPSSRMVVSSPTPASIALTGATRERIVSLATTSLTCVTTDLGGVWCGLPTGGAFSQIRWP